MVRISSRQFDMFIEQILSTTVGAVIGGGIAWFFRTGGTFRIFPIMVRIEEHLPNAGGESLGTLRMDLSLVNTSGIPRVMRDIRLRLCFLDAVISCPLAEIVGDPEQSKDMVYIKAWYAKKLTFCFSLEWSDIENATMAEVVRGAMIYRAGTRRNKSLRIGKSFWQVPSEFL